ncbi:toll/interleukin-1 receptor domain-containing protein [Parafrankia sp. EUN1f]|uniref:toll/interleukin-1 receptor domain-containing protein n=1 Tax=Parafrankia sp. EUN1f TaxID=102897 RepID=UPI0001C44731|nr:toll/interleukin-1 receptor domain-containing protein [Parafrankia sp. EUN1f]EFC83388.1 hypothetical protein FrEUN1fDRAFT_3478 [Parafrankia sp. EUN1f]
MRRDGEMRQRGSADAETFRWDFAVSYADSDKPWAEWVAWHLEDVGYRVHIEAWDVVAGTHRPAGAHAVLTQARRLVAVVSENYLVADRVQTDWLSFWAADPGGLSRALLPVRVDDSPVPDLLFAQIAPVSLVGLGEDEARRRLLDAVDAALAGRVKPSVPPPFPAASAQASTSSPGPEGKKPGRDPSRTRVDSTSAEGRVTRLRPDDALAADVFVGRGRETGELLGLLAPAAHGARPVTVVSVSGMGGIGKTALALRAAADADTRGYFPGGVYVTDLQGYGAGPDRGALGGRRSSGPAHVYGPLLALLRPDDPVPQSPMEQHGAYHQALTVLAERGQPVLLVLDNVADPGQIVDLLPRQQAHRVLVTTRDLGLGDFYGLPLAGLDVGAGVEVVDEVLRRRRPADRRATRQSESARRLVDLCWGLPLALRISAALLAEVPSRPIGELVADLADADNRLDHLDDGRQSIVARVLEPSWEHVRGHDPGAAELFQLLALNPSPEISTAAATALSGQRQAARGHLHTLQRAHLISWVATNRWRVPDPVALYAARRCADLESEVRHRAFERLLAHYQKEATEQARCAGWLLLRHNRPTSGPSTELAAWAARERALAWFTLEEPNLLGCVWWGDGRGLPGRLPSWRRYVVDLAAALTGYLRNNGPWLVAAEVHRLAADLATGLGDRTAQGIALNDLGVTYRLLGDERALLVLEQARRIFVGLGRFARRSGRAAARLGEANALNETAIVLNEAGRHEEALGVISRALRLYRWVGDPLGVANASKNLGATRYGLVRDARGGASLTSARGPLLAALDQYQQLDDRLGAAEARNHLGRLARRAGDVASARQEFVQALVLAQRVGSTLEEARAWWGIGDCQADVGENGGASYSLERADRLLARIGATTAQDRLTASLAEVRAASMSSRQ